MKFRNSTASTLGANAYLAWWPAPAPDGGTDGTSATVAISVTAVITTIARNEPRQPRVWPTSVPSGTPSAVDTETPETTIPIACPMRSGGTTDMPAMNDVAMNRPCNAP